MSIPKSIYVKRCAACGARPIIAIAGEGRYVVKCPDNDNHYQTPPGLIDLEDWNLNNKDPREGGYNLEPVIHKWA